MDVDYDVKSSQRRKVIVIGLDGATWRLLDDWIEKNEFPTLGEIARCGVKGNLKSAHGTNNFCNTLIAYTTKHRRKSIKRNI